MENASKALIIAGAILLAILLISLGIMIYNQAQNTVNNSGMSQAEIQAYNNRFMKYEGSNKTGSEVKSLVNEAIATNSDESIDAKVKVNNNESFSTSDIDTTAKYKVTLSYEKGRVSNIAYEEMTD